MAQEEKRRRSPSKLDLCDTNGLIEFWNSQVSVEQNIANEPLATTMIANYLSQRFWFGGREILVAGCGPHGRFLNMLIMAKSSRVVGVDFSPVAIMLLKKNFDDIEFVKSDISKLPFGDGEFDFSICIDTLSCILNEELFRYATLELCRVTKTDLLIIDTTTLSARLEFNASNRVLRTRDLHVQFASVMGMELSCVEEHYFGNPAHLDSRKTVMYFRRIGVPSPEQMLIDSKEMDGGNDKWMGKK